MQRNPLLPAFLLKTALFLPLCLAFWYWLAEWFSAPTALLSGWLMEQLFPIWVESAEWSHKSLTLITTLKLDTVGVQAGRFASMVPEVGPMSYCYGLPLYVALFLASGAKKHWGRLALGAVLLIPFQAWGICFDFLKQVAVTAGPGVGAQLGFAQWQRDGIALAYQLGTLILPTVAPVAVWLGLNRQFIPMLMLEGMLQDEHFEDTIR